MKMGTIEKALIALSPEQIRTPHLPMANSLQEAVDLAQLCRSPKVNQRLVAVGLSEGFVDDLVERTEVARAAQSEWVVVRDRSKDEDLVKLEAEAIALRSNLIASCRYNLPGSKEHGTLSAISGGDSLADLVQDLYDLAQLIEANLPSFDRDTSFDAPKQLQEARRLAERLSAGTGSERSFAQPLDIRDRRDRTFTYLDDLVTEIRNAGRYAFRNEPSIAKKFSSRYRRRTRGKGRRNQPGSADVVEEELVGEAI